MELVQSTKPFGAFSRFKVSLFKGRFGLVAFGLDAEEPDEVTGKPGVISQVDEGDGGLTKGADLIAECRRRVEASPAWADAEARAELV